MEVDGVVLYKLKKAKQQQKYDITRQWQNIEKKQEETNILTQSLY